MTFLRLYRLPPAFDATAAVATTSFLGYAVVLHILFAIWMYSNPDIFELEIFFDVGEASPILVTELMTTFIPFNASNTTNGTNITLNSNKHGYIYDLPSTYPNTSNAPGFYTSTNFSYYQEKMALADVGDSLAAVSEFQVGVRVFQSIQTAAYLPLLAVFLISWSVVVLLYIFPRCKKDTEELNQEMIAMLAAEKKDAEDAAAAARVALQEAKESSEAESTAGEGDTGGTVSTTNSETGQAGNDDYESIKAAALAEKLEALTHDIKKADERAQQMAIALSKSEGLDDLKYFEALPMGLLESRLALNQLDEIVLKEYQSELDRRKIRIAKKLLAEQGGSVATVATAEGGDSGGENL